MPIARAIRSHGYVLCVIDGNEHALAREIADIFYCADIRSSKELIALARALQQQREIALALTAGSDFTLQVAELNHALQIASTPIEVARRTTNKYAMRRRLQAAHIPIPRFHMITLRDDSAA